MNIRDFAFTPPLIFWLEPKNKTKKFKRPHPIFGSPLQMEMEQRKKGFACFTRKMSRLEAENCYTHLDGIHRDSNRKIFYAYCFPFFGSPHEDGRLQVL